MNSRIRARPTVGVHVPAVDPLAGGAGLKANRQAGHAGAPKKKKGPGVAAEAPQV